MYEIANGWLSPEQKVCHSCDNKDCVRLDHMFVGTSKDNSIDMVRKDRHARGTRQPRAKLNDDAVRDILSGGPPYSRQYVREMSKKYGVAYVTVSKVVWGRRLWKHVKTDIGNRADLLDIITN